MYFLTTRRCLYPDNFGSVWRNPNESIRFEFILTPRASSRSFWRLIAEEILEAHEGRDVPPGGILLFHEQFLPVRFLSHDVHPDLEGRFDDQIGMVRRSRAGP